MLAGEEMTPIHNIALSYLQKGWGVIPVDAKTKRPLLASWEEYQRRLPSVEEVNSWFNQFPSAGVGIVTGAVSGLGVVDADNEKGFASSQTLDLPKTYTVKTPHGWHYYYQHPGTHVKTCRDILGKDSKVDVRGDGGYVVGAYSVNDSGTYTVINDVAELPVFPSNVLALITKEEPKGDWQEAKDEAPWVSNLLQGGAERGERHTSLVRLSAYFISKGLPYDLVRNLLQGWNLRNTPPIEQSELEKQLEDVYERFKKGEWKPKTRTAGEQGQAYSLGAADEEVEVWEAEKGMPDYLSRLELRGRDAAYEMPIGFECLDKGTGGYKRGDVIVVAGYTGAGKTSFSINSVTGLCQRGLKTLFLSSELSTDEVTDRFLTVVTGLPLFSFTTGKFQRHDLQRIRESAKAVRNLDICDTFAPDLRSVEQALLKNKPDVVFFDHVQQAATSVDNRYNELSSFVRGFKYLMRKYDCAGVLVSQLNDLPEGQIKPTLKQVSESRVINQIASVVLLMWSPNTVLNGGWVDVTVEIAKVRTGGKRGEHPFRFNIENNRFEEAEVI
jgi:KaiC/GvpD/RAD55 family RecA-like ATPase